MRSETLPLTLGPTRLCCLFTGVEHDISLACVTEPDEIGLLSKPLSARVF